MSASKDMSQKGNGQSGVEVPGYWGGGGQMCITSMIQDFGNEVLVEKAPGSRHGTLEPARHGTADVTQYILPGLTCGHVKVPALTQPALRPVPQNLTRT